MIRFIDLFAGIGGIRIGLEQTCKELSLPYKNVLSSEIDKRACETYKLNFGEYPEGDIREIKTIPPFDILLAGFPCQPFSYAGKQKGFGDTRGTLFFETERILKQYKPKAFLLENVRGLTTHDKGRTFKTIIKALEDLGYGVNYVLLNSSNFGVPQNRVRIYIMGILGKKPVLNLVSDKGSADSHKFKRLYSQGNLFGDNQFKVVKDILEASVDKKYICSDKFIAQLKEVVGENFSKLHGVRLIDYRNGKSVHSWELGLKGKCNEDEILLLNSLVQNRRKKKYGEFQDGKRLNVEQMKNFYIKENIGEVVESLVAKGYLKPVEGKYNPVAGNMSFEVFKFLDPDSISITLVSSDAHKLGVVVNNVPRRITPREAGRIQGFPDNFKLHPIDTHAFKQLGNAVSVPVIKAIMADFITTNNLFTVHTQQISSGNKKQDHTLVFLTQ